MAQKDMSESFMNKSCKMINAEPKVEREEVVGTLKKIHPPKTETPNRELVAEAATKRAKEEQEKKKARREKAARQKEETRISEEENIQALKRAAAVKAEAFERKEAIKSANAKSDAAAAAEERAAKAKESEEREAKATATAALLTHHFCTTEEIQKVYVSMSDETQLSKECAEKNAALVQRSRYKRHKEEVRREEESEVKKQVAAETAKALDRKETVKAAQAQAAAAKGKDKLLSSSCTEAQDEVTDVMNEDHKLMASSENMTSSKILYHIKEEEPLNPIVTLKTQNQLREISGLQTSTEIDEQEINRNIMHSHANEKEHISTVDSQEDGQKIKGFYEEAHHSSQNSVRPKGEFSGSLIHAENSLAGQNSGQPHNSSNIIANQQNKNTIYRQEREQVTGNKALQSRYSGGQKEVVSVTGHEKHTENESEESLRRGGQKEVLMAGYEKYTGNESEESLRGEGEKPDIHYAELNSKREIKKSEVRENEKEHIEGYQNGHGSGNRGLKDVIHQGEHSCKSQQYYTPPQRNESFHHSHQQNYKSSAERKKGFQVFCQQPYHREQQNHSHNHDQRRKGHHNYSVYSYHSHAQHMPQFCGPPSAMVCGCCGEKFNLQEKLPRNLYCGHSICTLCISIQIYHGTEVLCPSCHVYTWHIKSADHCPVNQPLLKILSEEGMQDKVIKSQRRKGPHLPDSGDTRQYSSQPGSDNMARSGIGQERNKSLPPPKSPHGSKCMEIGVRPSSYCCTCNVWVCARCAEAEHSTRRCYVKSLRDQLTVMKQRIENMGSGAQEILGKSLQSLETSLNEDKVFLIWMRAAIECMEKRQECMKKELKEGRELMNTLTNAMKSIPSATNLVETLAIFQRAEDIANAAQQWVSIDKLSSTGGDQETTACLRHLMRRTLRSFQAENETVQMYAVDNFVGTELHSELRVDGGRFLLHALRQSCPTNQGVRALPLECFKMCQPAASALVFLNLSWGGMDHGRLYIRLTGDTLRGHQFINLCLGEGGTSFQGTCFHRVWWKGLPGEHIWTGDYEKGDGSGGRPLLSSDKHEKIPAGREVPISAGLVAGRYEKENISSIFRIYTTEEKGGKDEAGFGQVEFGLDVLKEAVKLKNIRDVTISDCGLVLEM